MHYSACTYLPPADAGGLCCAQVDGLSSGLLRTRTSLCMPICASSIICVPLDEHFYVPLCSVQPHARAHAQCMYPPYRRLRRDCTSYAPRLC